MKSISIFILAAFLFSCSLQKEKTKMNNASYGTLTVNELIKLLFYGIPKDTSIKLGLINIKGDTIIKPKYQAISNFYGNYANVIKDSIYGYIDKEGNETLFPQYEEVYWFDSEIGTVKNNDKYGLIKRDGSIIIPLIYEMIGSLNNGFFSVKENNKWGYINQSGERLMPNKFNYEAQPVFSNQIIIRDTLKKDNKNEVKFGIIDTYGNVVIKPKYDAIKFYINDNLILVINKNKFGIINLKGDTIIPLEYSDISYNLREGLLFAKLNDKYGYINLKNEIIIPFEYTKAENFSDGLAVVYKDKKAFYINKNNVIVMDVKGDLIWQNMFKNGLAVFKTNGKFGYININKEVIINPIYEEATVFQNDRAFVTLNKKSGIINSKGKVILPLIYDKLSSGQIDIIVFGK